jgi:hypothetical protein
MFTGGEFLGAMLSPSSGGGGRPPLLLVPRRDPKQRVERKC